MRHQKKLIRNSSVTQSSQFFNNLRHNDLTSSVIVGKMTHPNITKNDCYDPDNLSNCQRWIYLVLNI